MNELTLKQKIDTIYEALPTDSDKKNGKKKKEKEFKMPFSIRRGKKKLKKVK